MTVANTRVTQILLKRGNTVSSSNYTGTRSELTHDTGAVGNGPHTVRIHDGQTPGGTVIASQAYVNTAIANIGISSTYSNSNVASYLVNLNSNIIPSANAVYSLGSPTRQWKDLWVSNATIYLNTVPLGLDATGNLTFDGNPLVSYVNGNLNVGGDVINAGSITSADASTGNLLITLSDATVIDAGRVVGPEGAQGEPGTQGIQGVQGVQGTQGNTGPRGEQGIQGIQGNVGPQGSQGIQGIQGNVGAQGAQGVQGETGPQGIQGNVGATGPQGIQGNVGPQGTQGEQGIQGNTGPTGAQGIQGNIGASGAQGIQGIKGDRGDQGISVTLVGNVASPGDLNFSGNAGEAYIVTSSGNLYFWNTTISSWADIGPIVGPRGDKGDTGEQGIQGNVGLQGETGPTGAQGEPGPQGIQGIQGNVGLQGDIGPTGAQGDPGVPGPQGDPGPEGPQGDLGPGGPQGEQGVSGDPGPQGNPGPQGDPGPAGDPGPQGEQGVQGEAGAGVPVGGTAGQVLAKVDGDDYHTEWVDQTGGASTGNFTFKADRITNDDDTSIVVGGGSLVENVVVDVVDQLVPPGGVWRMFFLDADYLNLGTIVEVGDTVITSWGTPITAAITDIVQDISVGTWALHFDQDITAEFNAGDTVTFNRGPEVLLIPTSKTWTFGTNGNLAFPQGSTIGETDNTTVISPPGAAAGQSLVIRPTTSAWSVTSSANIEYGNLITISVNYISTFGIDENFGTVNYEITGTGVTEEELGRPLTGNVVFLGGPEEGSQTVTWTIPNNSNITEFTFTLTGVDGINRNSDLDLNDPALYYGFINLPTGTFATVTNNGISNSDASHIHLVAGNPVTTDIYLGDDDQYVKIEKNGGNVVVGTDSNTNHWTFGTNGNLTFPDATVQTTAFPGFPDLLITEDTAPESGALWFNTVEARMYVKYNNQWIDASPTVLSPPDTNPDVESVTFNDATIQTTAWPGTLSYNDLTDKPATPVFVGGGSASTWLTAE